MKTINNRPFILQQFIKTSFGKDIRVYVVGNEVVGCIKRENKNGDFRANVEIGGIGVPYSITDEQKRMAISVVKNLGLDFGGIDILFGEDNEPIFCEANSNAYFIQIDKVLNIKVEDYIIKYVVNCI